MNYVSFLLSLTFLATVSSHVIAVAPDLLGEVKIPYYTTANGVYKQLPGGFASVFIRVDMPWRDIEETIRKKVGDGDLRRGSVKLDQWRTNARVTPQDFKEIDMFSFWPPMP